MSKPPPASSETAPSPRPADRRRYVYTALDLALAALYTVLISAAPTRHLGGAVLLWSLVAVILVMGVAMCVPRRQAWWVAVIGCGLLLTLELVLLAMLVASAAFLAGVYGSFGQGGAVIGVLAALLSIELVALVPAFQLHYLCTRAGRRAFGRDASPT